MVYGAVIPRLPDIRDSLGLEVSTLGLVLTLSALGGLLGSALSGPFIARYGTRRSIITGTVVTVAVLPLVGVARSVVALVLCLAVLSVVDVVVDIGMNVQGSALSARRRHPVMNRLHGLWSLGTVAGGLIAVRAAGSGVSVSAHLLGVSLVLGLTLAVSGRYLLPADGGRSVPPPDAEDSVDRLGSGGSRAGAGGSRPAGRVLILGLLGGAAVTMEMTTSDWAAFRLADDLGVVPGRVGLGFVAFTSGMVTGRFAGDVIQGIVGVRALVRGAAILATVGIAIATLIPPEVSGDLGPLSSVLTPTVVTVAGYFVAALGVSVIFPQLYDAAAKTPGPPGRGLASLTAGTRVANLSAPIAVGVLADTVLNVGTSVAIVTLPCCALTFLVLAPDPDRADESAAPQ